MENWMQIIMLSCKKATALIEKRTLFGLTSREALQLKMHTSMCNVCRAYAIQSRIIDDALRIFKEDRDQIDLSVSKEFKRRIIKNLEME